MKGAEPEFYIGWAPTPPAERRFLRLVVLGLLLTVAGVAAALVAGMRREPRATFAYGRPSAWQGRVVLRPAPILWTRDGHALLLVGSGKHGAAGALAGADGTLVELRGSLIEREGLLGMQRMLEIEPGALRPIADGDPIAAPRIEPLGHVRWGGELADGKCYLGVMVPGEGKAHRDCAARCLAGGTPPLLALADGRGGAAAVLLNAADGEPLGPRLAPYAGEPVWLSGELARVGDLLVLTVDAPGVERGR